MEKGGVYSGRWIWWLPAGRKAPMVPGGEALLKPKWNALRPPTLSAQRCPTCRIAEVFY